jgi:hypothetical protein
VPTLFVHGRQDLVVPLEAGRKISEEFPAHAWPSLSIRATARHQMRPRPFEPPWGSFCHQLDCDARLIDQVGLAP